MGKRDLLLCLGARIDPSTKFHFTSILNIRNDEWCCESDQWKCVVKK